MLWETISAPLRKALSSNATDSSFASRIPTTTEPTGAGVVDIAPRGGASQNIVLMVPYGVGGDGDTFDMRLVGWRKVASNINQSLILWVPVSLVEVSCTVSTPVGIANADRKSTRLNSSHVSESRMPSSA